MGSTTSGLRRRQSLSQLSSILLRFPHRLRHPGHLYCLCFCLYFCLCRLVSLHSLKLVGWCQPSESEPRRGRAKRARSALARRSRARQFGREAHFQRTTRAAWIEGSSPADTETPRERRSFLNDEPDLFLMNTACTYERSRVALYRGYPTSRVRRLVSSSLLARFAKRIIAAERS